MPTHESHTATTPIPELGVSDKGFVSERGYSDRSADEKAIANNGIARARQILAEAQAQRIADSLAEAEARMAQLPPPPPVTGE